MLIWILLTVLYYFFLLYPLFRYRAFDGIVAKKANGILTLFVYFAVGVLIYTAISKEQFIYYWDYGGYYDRTIFIKNMYKENAVDVLKNVYESSTLSDYGTWISAVMAFPLRLTQGRFADYVMLVYVIFAVPAAFSLSLLGGGYFSERCHKYFLSGCNLLILLMPWYLQPMLEGYPGIAAFVPLICALWIFLKSEGLYKLTIPDVIVFSFSLIAAALLRRYFCFYIVGFVVGGICYSICYWRMYRHTKAELFHYAASYIKVGCISIFSLLLFFPGFLQRVLFVDYAGMYTAYNNGGMLEKCRAFIDHLGVLLLFLILFAAVVVCQNYRKYVPLFLFCFIFEVVTAVCFFSVQSVGIHHYWTFLLPLLLLLMLFLNIMMIGEKKSYLVLCCICFFYNTSYVYFGSSVPMMNAAICQRDFYVPKNRTDLEAVGEFTEYLQSIQEDKKIYCIASGSVLNNDILSKYYLPNTCPLQLSAVSHVDLRDGFSTEFFTSDIVVTTEPVQIHLREENQQVITILQKEFTNEHSKIRSHFEKIHTTELAEGVIVNVYLKKSGYTEEDISYLEGLYDSVYPDYMELFHDRFEEVKKWI